MADPRIILGRIVTVNGTTPGPSNGISYTIAVHDPNVEGIYRLEQQAPSPRWSTDIDITAVPVGTIVIGTVEANRVRWHFIEMPAFANCPSSDFAARAMQLLAGGGGTLPPTQGPNTDTGTIGSGDVGTIPGPDTGEA